jgi:hypothetical protein
MWTLNFWRDLGFLNLHQKPKPDEDNTIKRPSGGRKSIRHKIHKFCGGLE